MTVIVTKKKTKIVGHLFTKTADQVDKVAGENKADRDDVEKEGSVVLAIPNVAVLPDKVRIKQ